MPLALPTQLRELPFSRIPTGSVPIEYIEAIQGHGSTGVFTGEVTAPFHCSRFLITRALWREVMGEMEFKWGGASSSESEPFWPATGMGREVIDIFLERGGRLLGKTLKLPTIVQWMVACSGGKDHIWYWAKNREAVKNVQETSKWVPVLAEDHSDVDRLLARAPRMIGQYPQSPFGLYDMLAPCPQMTRERFTMSESAPYPIAGQFPPNHGVAKDIVGNNPDGEGASYCASAVDTPIGLLICRRPYFDAVYSQSDPMIGFRVIIDD